MLRKVSKSVYFFVCLVYHSSWSALPVQIARAFVCISISVSCSIFVFFQSVWSVHLPPSEFVFSKCSKCFTTCLSRYSCTSLRTRGTKGEMKYVPKNFGNKKMKEKVGRHRNYFETTVESSELLYEKISRILERNWTSTLVFKSEGELQIWEVLMDLFAQNNEIVGHYMSVSIFLYFGSVPQ